MNRISMIVMNLVIVCAVVIGSVMLYTVNKELNTVSSDLKGLDQKVDTMQKSSDQRLNEIITKLDSLPKRRTNAAPVDEEAMSGAFAEISDLISEGEFETAKTKLAEFLKEYGSSPMASRAIQLEKEFAIIGTDAPKEWGIQKWYQGEKEVSLNGDHTTFVVFWETWCPHCKDVIPQIQNRYERYKGKGLQVVGITKVNKGSTDQKVLDFIKEKEVTFAIAKEDQILARFFNVKGVPSAAVVKNDKVVWIGHPAYLTDKLLETYLGSSDKKS